VRAARVKVEVVFLDDNLVEEEPVTMEMKNCDVDLTMVYGVEPMYGLRGQVINHIYTGKNKLTLKAEN
jgi:hypothetical protein